MCVCACAGIMNSYFVVSVLSTQDTMGKSFKPPRYSVKQIGLYINTRTSNRPLSHGP